MSMRFLVLAVVAVGLVSCGAEQGPEGPAGPRGATGPAGPAGPQGEDADPPAYIYRTVNNSDSSGVATTTCPGTYTVVGGGGRCLGTSDVLFGAVPAGNSFVVGCYDYGATGGAAEAFAICVRSTNPDTVQQGLSSAVDPDAEVAARAMREQRERAKEQR